MDDIMTMLSLADITTVLSLVAVVLFAAMIWGTILNGLRITFLSWPHFSIMRWRFWVYGLFTWIVCMVSRYFLGIY